MRTSMSRAHADCKPPGTGTGAPLPPLVSSLWAPEPSARPRAAWIGFIPCCGRDDIPHSLRNVLGFNERVVRDALYSDGHLVRTYPASAIGKIKVNGDIGMENPIDQAAWCLDLAPVGGPARQLTIADIRSLPRYEETIDFKCVEGWSTVTQFAGARLSDFTAKFAPGSEKAAYVGMGTPSKDYYVGLRYAERSASADPAGV